MLELKALLLTQGMHGMVSQVEGLAKALKLSFKHKEIKLKPIWNFVPPKLTPISENFSFQFSNFNKVTGCYKRPKCSKFIF